MSALRFFVFPSPFHEHFIRENSTKAQAQQKVWYRERATQPGEQVLVLLPTSTSKLLVQYSGRGDMKF